MNYGEMLANSIVNNDGSTYAQTANQALTSALSANEQAINAQNMAYASSVNASSSFANLLGKSSADGTPATGFMGLAEHYAKEEKASNEDKSWERAKLAEQDSINKQIQSYGYSNLDDYNNGINTQIQLELTNNGTINTRLTPDEAKYYLQNPAMIDIAIQSGKLTLADKAQLMKVSNNANIRMDLDRYNQIKSHQTNLDNNWLQAQSIYKVAQDNKAENALNSYNTTNELYNALMNQQRIGRQQVEGESDTQFLYREANARQQLQDLLASKNISAIDNNSSTLGTDISGKVSATGNIKANNNQNTNIDTNDTSTPQHITGQQAIDMNKNDGIPTQLLDENGNALQTEEVNKILNDQQKLAVQNFKDTNDLMLDIGDRTWNWRGLINDAANMTLPFAAGVSAVGGAKAAVQWTWGAIKSVGMKNFAKGMSKKEAQQKTLEMNKDLNRLHENKVDFMAGSDNIEEMKKDAAKVNAGQMSIDEFDKKHYNSQASKEIEEKLSKTKEGRSFLKKYGKTGVISVGLMSVGATIGLGTDTGTQFAKTSWQFLTGSSDSNDFMQTMRWFSSDDGSGKNKNYMEKDGSGYTQDFRNFILNTDFDAIEKDLKESGNINLYDAETNAKIIQLGRNLQKQFRFEDRLKEEKELNTQNSVARKLAHPFENVLNLEEKINSMPDGEEKNSLIKQAKTAKKGAIDNFGNIARDTMINKKAPIGRAKGGALGKDSLEVAMIKSATGIDIDTLMSDDIANSKVDYYDKDYKTTESENFYKTVIKRSDTGDYDFGKSVILNQMSYVLDLNKPSSKNYVKAVLEDKEVNESLEIIRVNSQLGGELTMSNRRAIVEAEKTISDKLFNLAAKYKPTMITGTIPKNDLFVQSINNGARGNRGLWEKTKSAFATAYETFDEFTGLDTAASKITQGQAQMKANRYLKYQNGIGMKLSRGYSTDFKNPFDVITYFDSINLGKQ